MADEVRTRSAAAGRALLSAVAGALGAGAMGLAGRELLAIAGTSAGTEALVAWVLVGGAALGALLCLRLALVWTLAAGFLLAGPTGRTGTALLAALRVLAPRLARRLTTGAALATAATALALGPAMAAPTSVLLEDDGPGHATSQQTSRMLLEVDAPAAEDEADVDEADGDETPQDDAETSPPPLGWGETAPPAEADVGTDADTDTQTGTSPGPSADATGEPAAGPAADPDPAAASPGTERTVTVHTGDSLWSISEDLLGQGAATDPEIAAAWPLLHAANQDRIGADPDLLHPGLELVVPAELTTQDMP